MAEVEGAPSGKRVLHVGVDWVTLTADALVIQTPVEIPGWEPRPFRRLAVAFDGRRWDLVGRGLGRDGRVRYDFVPWPEDRADPPGQEVAYDEAFVAAREAARAAARREERQGFAVGLMLPFLGLLWVRTKERIASRYQLSAQGATRMSLFVEYMTMIGCCVLFIFTAFVGRFTGVVMVQPLPLIVIALVILPDLMFRRDALLRGDPIPPGFYEWLVHRKPPAGWGTGGW